MTTAVDSTSVRRARWACIWLSVTVLIISWLVLVMPVSAQVTLDSKVARLEQKVEDIQRIEQRIERLEQKLDAIGAEQQEYRGAVRVVGWVLMLLVTLIGGSHLVVVYGQHQKTRA